MHLKHGTTVFQHHVDLPLLLIEQHLDVIGNDTTNSEMVLHLYQLHHILVVQLLKESDLALHIRLPVGNLPQLPLLHDLDGSTDQGLTIYRLLYLGIAAFSQNITHDISAVEKKTLDRVLNSKLLSDRPAEHLGCLLFTLINYISTVHPGTRTR